MHRWQLQDAKARFSELVRRAQADGPQEVTLHGEPKVVVIAKADYDRLRAPKPSFTAFLGASPLAGFDLEIERNTSPPRDTSL